MTRPGPVPAPGAAGMEEVFGQERARLVGLAYRITGSRSDAEDLVQEAWLRAQRVDWASVDRPAAWLTTVVSRLALDELRSARRRRETYVGPWLPDPVLTAVAEPAAAAGTGAGARGRPTVSEAEDVDPAAIVELAESLTYGFLRMLEALDPVERVVFLLADVFDTPFDEIAAAVGRSPAACRQVASRARRRVREGRVRRDLPADARRVAYEMLAMVAAGDVEAVMALLADDAVLVSDGGASVRAARRPVVGPARIARFLVNLDRRYPYRVVRTVTVNGEPGMVMHVGERTQLVVAVEVVAGRVHAIHAISNPEKLAALGIATPLA